MTLEEGQGMPVVRGPSELNVQRVHRYPGLDGRGARRLVRRETAAPIAVRAIAPSRSSRYSRPLFNVSPSSQPAIIPTADSLAI